MKSLQWKQQHTDPQGGVRGRRSHPRRLRPLGRAGLFGRAGLAAGIVAATVGVPAATLPANAATCSLGAYDAYSFAVASEADLQKVGTECSLDATYYLTANITLTAPAPGGSNHTPIGSLATPFTGDFEGNGFTISGLVINRPTVDYQGFFGVFDGWNGSCGCLYDLKLTNVSIVGQDYVGAVAGKLDRGAANSSEVSGTVTGRDSVGGLAGWSYRGGADKATISVTVSGRDKVGGVIGDGTWNLTYGGKIKTATVKGSVTGTGTMVGGAAGSLSPGWELGGNTVEADVDGGDDYVGGLAGYVLGSASTGLKAYSNVSEGDIVAAGSYVGGLLGYSESIDSSWGANTASGDVTVTGGGSYIGGYAGFLKNGWLPYGGSATGEVSAPSASRVGGFAGGSGNIDFTAASASGDVTGATHVGGLIGYMESSCCDLLNSQASGNVTATTNGGGLVGTIDGTTWDVGGYTGNVSGVRVRRSKSTGSVTVGAVGGGLVGQVIAGSNVIENSYSRSEVSGGGPVGGLVGQVAAAAGPIAGGLTLTNSYAQGEVTNSSGTAGGLVGSVEAGSAITPTALFWDTDTTKQAASAEGTGKTTADMQLYATFNDASWSIAEGWSGAKTWGICKANDGYPYLAWEGSSTAVCMTAPTGLVASPRDGGAQITFTPGDDFGTPITNYEYQLDGGSWVALSPTDDSSPVTLTGLNNGTEYSIKLRAVSTLGKSPESDAVKVTPAVPTAPDAPTSLSATALDTGVKITFTPGADNGSALTNYEYQLDGGSWVAFSPADTTSPVTIFGLTNGTEYSIKLRAVNGVGTSPASDPVLVTPVAAPVKDGESLPELTPGSRQVTVDGVPVTVTLEVQNTTDLVLKSDGFELRLAGGCTGGACELLEDVDGNAYMQLRTGGEVQVSGFGFKPNSVVHVWIFSTPKYVGKLNVASDGTFTGWLNLPAGITVGSHTLQVNGWTPEDAERTANMGVLLKPGELPATGVDSGPLVAAIIGLLVAGATMTSISRRSRRTA